MRPGWDHYFMIIADAVSLRATCDRARVGSVIVSEDMRILSTGYNGAPSGWPSCDEQGHQLVDMGGRQSCIRAVHAEENAVVSAARSGTRLIGSTCYTTASPCYDCFRMLAQAGVTRIVFGENYSSARTGSVDVFELAQDRGLQMERQPLLHRIKFPPQQGE